MSKSRCCCHLVKRRAVRLVWRRAVHPVYCACQSWKFNQLCVRLFPFLFGFECRMWNLIVLIPDHCLFFYFDCSWKLIPQQWGFMVCEGTQVAIKMAKAYSDDCVKHGSFRVLNACTTQFSCVCMKHVCKRVDMRIPRLSRFPNRQSNRFPGYACETRFAILAKFSWPINSVHLRLPLT